MAQPVGQIALAIPPTTFEPTAEIPLTLFQESFKLITRNVVARPAVSYQSEVGHGVTLRGQD